MPDVYVSLCVTIAFFAHSITLLIPKGSSIMGLYECMQKIKDIDKKPTKRYAYYTAIQPISFL